MTEPFRLFSGPHLAVLVLVTATNIGIYLARDKFKNGHVNRIVRLTMAFLLIITFLAMQAWDALHGVWTVQSSLPLHLCSVSQIMCIIMLITRKYVIYEITYFWGLGGATQALLTPDLAFPFPHLVFFLFMGAHAVIVTACLWMTFAEEYRPGFKSLLKAWGALNLYMLFVAVINIILGSNYLYICQKPVSPSIIDYLGPWPWYLPVLEAVAFVVFLLCYLPFHYKKSTGADKRHEIMRGM